jgi:hypothetical protein
LKLKEQKKGKGDKKMKKKDKKFGRMIFYHIGDLIGIINETSQKILRNISMSKRKKLYKRHKIQQILGVYWQAYVVV